MERLKTSITVDPTIWKKFRVACLEHGMLASYIVEKLVMEQIDKWKKEKKDA